MGGVGFWDGLEATSFGAICTAGSDFSVSCLGLDERFGFELKIYLLENGIIT